MIHGVGPKKKRIARNASVAKGAGAKETTAADAKESEVRVDNAKRALEKLGQRVSSRPTPGGASGLVGARAIAQRDGNDARTFAAIDLGSSSVKMLVQRMTSRGELVTILDKKIGVTLGKGVAVGGAIPAENQTRALAGLQELIRDAVQLGVLPGEIPMITTAVVRNSSNGAQFLSQVHALGLLRARTLTGPEEAATGYRGALHMLADESGRIAPGRYATLDLGGGSFQLAIGDENDVTEGASTQVGSNILLDTVVKPRLDATGAWPTGLAAELDTWLRANAPMPLAVDKLAGRTLVATGGVSKFLRAHFGKDVITRADIEALRRDVSGLAETARVDFVRARKDAATQTALGIDTPEGALDYGRKLPASASLLLHILTSIGVDEVRVSETDARHLLIAGSVA